MYLIKLTTFCQNQLQIQKTISHQPLIIILNPTVRLHIIELCIIYLKIIMIQRLDLPRSKLNRAYLKMDELLFNMHETLPENALPISTVQNVGNIQTHHISKNENDPTVEEREIGQRLNCPSGAFPFLFSRKFTMMISVKRIVFLPISPVSQQRSVIRITYPKSSMI